MPNALVKHATARPPISARPAINASSGTATAPAVETAALERAEKNQELADETVQRRQTRNRHRANEKSRRRPRHPFQQPAEVVNFMRSGAMHHRARAEEQQSLEQGVIEHVQQRAAKAQHHQHGRTRAHAQQADAQAQRDDADVFDAVIRQQALQVVLRQRKQHAQHTRSQPDGDESPPPPQRAASQKRERAQSIRKFPS